jgi:uncharacterized cupin superfamily protein
MTMHSLIVASKTDVPLLPCPIEPSWVVKGNPTAQISVLSRSNDGLASTLVWECTEGIFNWHYNYDETIHFLEGSVVIEGGDMRPTRFGAGDVLFFRRGAHALWTVEQKIRKLSFCRTSSPAIVGLAIRAGAKIMRKLPRLSGGKVVAPMGERPG